METDLVVLIVLAGLGTYGLRAIPLLWWSRRSSSRTEEQGCVNWLQAIGPMLIAAIFAVSAVPERGAITSLWSLVPTVSGLLATGITFQRIRNMGLPVFAGVAVYGLVGTGLVTVGVVS